MSTQNLENRVEILENRLKRTRVILIAMSIVIGAFVIAGFSSSPASSIQESVKTRALIIVDESGKERIILGAPMPSPAEGERISAVTGMMINDPNGRERFGLGLMENGSVVMGFDAPPGVGDPRNRERLTFAVYPSGTAAIRILDNSTRVKTMLFSDRKENAWLSFLDWSTKEPTFRNIGLPEAIQMQVEEPSEK